MNSYFSVGTMNNHVCSGWRQFKFVLNFKIFPLFSRTLKIYFANTACRKRSNGKRGRTQFHHRIVYYNCFDSSAIIKSFFFHFFHLFWKSNPLKSLTFCKSTFPYRFNAFGQSNIFKISFPTKSFFSYAFDTLAERNFRDRTVIKCFLGNLFYTTGKSYA